MAATGTLPSYREIRDAIVGRLEEVGCSDIYDMANELPYGLPPSSFCPIFGLLKERK